MPHRALLKWLLVEMFVGTLVVLCFSPNATGAVWRFVVFSDTQCPYFTNQINEEVLRELAVAATNERPDFVLFGGDMANAPVSGTIESWIALMGPVFQAGIPVYPAPGNHDAGVAAEISQWLGPGLPENGPEGELGQTYAIQNRNALVMVLNSVTATNHSRVNQGWVDAVLATNQQPHVFAISHIPAFKVFHSDALGLYPLERNAFWKSLKAGGCRMYFCGHDHFYDHARIDDGDGNPDDDVHQFILGTGGAAFYADPGYDGDNAPYNPVRAFHDPQYGYLRVEVDGYQVTATWCPRVAPGSFLPGRDVFVYTFRPRLQLQRVGSALALSWSPPAILQVSTDLGGPFTNLVTASPPLLLTNLIEPRLFYRLMLP